jgi:hypothetical protein
LMSTTTSVNAFLSGNAVLLADRVATLLGLLRVFAGIPLAHGDASRVARRVTRQRLARLATAVAAIYIFPLTDSRATRCFSLFQPCVLEAELQG